MAKARIADVPGAVIRETMLIGGIGVSGGGWRRGFGRGAAAWLLSLVLCLGSIGDLLAASRAVDGPFPFPGEICHGPGSADQGGGKAESRSVHDCCVVCHAIPDHQLAPPPAVFIGPVGTAAKVVFAPVHAPTPPNHSTSHENARAPPRA